MSHSLISLSSDRLRETVRSTCLHIVDGLEFQMSDSWNENELRLELVECILGSQVRYETASALTQNLLHAGLLEDFWWTTNHDDQFGLLVLEVLSGKRSDLPHNGSHRFSKSRTNLLTRARDSVVQIPLETRIQIDCTPKQLRQQLVADIPGLGPKQASLFLRNIGLSYDLAVIDVHMLRYLDLQGLLSLDQSRVGSIAAYEKVERIAIEYADSLGQRVGYLDLAIWATMKAARELGL